MIDSRSGGAGTQRAVNVVSSDVVRIIIVQRRAPAVLAVSTIVVYLRLPTHTYRHTAMSTRLRGTGSTTAAETYNVKESSQLHCNKGRT